MREALENARCDETRIAEIESLLAATPADEKQHVEIFLASVIEGAVTMNEFRGIDARPIRTNFEARLDVGQSETWTRCVTELQQLGVKPLEAVAVAVARAVKIAPDAFGRLERWPSEDEPPRLPALLKALPDLCLKARSFAPSLVDERLSLYRLNWAWRTADTTIPLSPTPQSTGAFIEWLAQQ